MRFGKLAIVSIALLVPCLATAQIAPPPQPPRAPRPGLGKWWKNSEVAKNLGLSEAQVNQIEQIFLEQRLKLIDLRADLEKQETQLEALMDVDQPDEAKVSAQIDQVLAARGRLEKTNAMMMLSIRRVLSVEQWKKLQAIQQERTPHAPGAPFGPPGGPPRPPHPPDEPNL